MDFNPVKIFFKSLALAVVAGAIGFFAGNFLSIVGLALYGTFTHHTPDFSLAYRRGGASVGIIAFCLVFIVSVLRDLRLALRGQ